MAIGRMPIACWMTKATNVILEYVIIIAFPGNNVYTKAPPYYAIRTLHVLCIKQCILRSLIFLRLIKTIRFLIICFSTMSIPVAHMSLFFILN